MKTWFMNVFAREGQDSKLPSSCGGGRNWQIGRPRHKNGCCYWFHTDAGLCRARLGPIVWCVYGWSVGCFKEDSGSDVLMAVWAGNTDTSPLSTQNLSVLLGGRGNKHLVFCELRIILH